MKVSFIGLGSLGLPLAKRLLSEGVNLTVWNRTVEKTKTLNCPVAKSLADLILGHTYWCRDRCSG